MTKFYFHKYLLTFILFSLCAFSAFAQQKYTLSGTVKDDNGEPEFPLIVMTGRVGCKAHFFSWHPTQADVNKANKTAFYMTDDNAVSIGWDIIEIKMMEVFFHKNQHVYIILTKTSDNI